MAYIVLYCYLILLGNNSTVALPKNFSLLFNYRHTTQDLWHRTVLHLHAMEDGTWSRLKCYLGIWFIDNQTSGIPLD
jgi:hypothetical protein